MNGRFNQVGLVLVDQHSQAVYFLVKLVYLGSLAGVEANIPASKIQHFSGRNDLYH